MSRLQRGQTAIGVLKRKEACKKSVLARMLVFEGLQNGDPKVAPFAEHFKSVAALSEWSCHERKIEKVSIKTLRAHIEVLYEGGMKKFKEDLQRLGNKAAAKKPPSTKQLAGNRAYAVLQMVQRYEDLVERMSQEARNSEPASRALRAHFRKFGDLPGEDESQVIYVPFGKKSSD